VASQIQPSHLEAEAMTDAAFRAWVQTKRSCLTGKFAEWLTDIGEHRNPACHVRRAGEAGTGYKPPYSAVPLTNVEHDYQHRHGELAVIQKFNPVLARTVKTEWQAKDWFDAKAEHYRRAWYAHSGDKEVLEFIREPQLMGQQ
jgi:hypothetical protein